MTSTAHARTRATGPGRRACVYWQDVQKIISADRRVPERWRHVACHYAQLAVRELYTRGA